MPDLMPPRRERLEILGEVNSPSFVPWIKRHSGRLGLEASAFSVAPGRIGVTVAGQPDLIDALEVGCLLGPIDVWVSAIDRAPVADLI